MLFIFMCFIQSRGITVSTHIRNTSFATVYGDRASLYGNRALLCTGCATRGVLFHLILDIVFTEKSISFSHPRGCCAGRTQCEISLKQEMKQSGSKVPGTRWRLCVTESKASAS